MTNGGKKISGRFLIVNEKTITVKENIIQLTEIARIKKNPLLGSIITDFLMLYGLYVVTGFIGIATNSNAVHLILFIPSAIFIVAKSPNITNSYKQKINWDYEIILSE